MWIADIKDADIKGQTDRVCKDFFSHVFCLKQKCLKDYFVNFSSQIH